MSLQFGLTTLSPSRHALSPSCASSAAASPRRGDLPLWGRWVRIDQLVSASAVRVSSQKRSAFLDRQSLEDCRMSQEVQHDEQGHEHGHEGARDNAAASAQGINLTPKALEMVKQMHMKEGLGAEQGLRISVVGGGCSGFQYSLSFDAHKEGDTEQEIEGTKIFVDE